MSIHEQGLFVTLEGVEGAGKSSRCRNLIESLRARGLKTVHTREPGGPPVSERIRSVLLDRSLEVPPMTELLLYLASRSANVSLVVEPALRRGSIVVCERYSDATRAYQAGGRRISLEDVESSIRFATGGLEPDLTILLDLDPVVGLERISRRNGSRDRIELEGIEFHERVRSSYLELAERHTRFMVVDAALPQSDQDGMILDRVLELVRAQSFEP